MLIDEQLSVLKERLLVMASRVEAAVNRAIKALMRRDDQLARQIKQEDTVIDRLQMEIDRDALALLEAGPRGSDLRFITMGMKIAHDLERVGDEATTISRRCLDLSLEPPLRHQADVPPMATLALQMLKDALDAFVNRDPAKARGVIPRDSEVDARNKDFHRELTAFMAEDPKAIARCLHLMVIAKSLERIADHATNVAEEVVYLYEGNDIRHSGKPAPARMAGQV